MSTRFRDGPGAPPTDNVNELAKCPQCGGRAEVVYRLLDGPIWDGQTVMSVGAGANRRERGVWRVVCTRCTFYADPPPSPPHVPSRGVWDHVFGLPSWLQTPCAGEVLWAWNVDHLDFLEAYVAADLRERTPNMNRSLASRLPRWIKSAKNRDEVLKGIRRLRERLAEGNAIR